MKKRFHYSLLILCSFAWCSASAQPKAQNLNQLVIQFNQSYPKELKKIKAAIREGKVLKAEEFGEDYKKLIFDIYIGYNAKIAKTESTEQVTKKDRDDVFFLKSALEKLEYRESEVDRASEELNAHYVYLETKKYGFKKRAFLDFVSWQTEATLSGPSSSTALLANNMGYQLGLGLTYENSFWSFGAELAGLYGYGGVSNISGSSTYQQSSVPAYGGRLSVSGARVVSSTGSLLGIKVAGLFLQQTLTTPSVAGYSINQDRPLSFTATLFTQWRFQNYYFETEFGRYIAKPSTLWALGLGMLI